MKYRSNLTSSQIVAAVDLGLRGLRERLPKNLHREVDLMLEMTDVFLNGRADEERA